MTIRSGFETIKSQSMTHKFCTLIVATMLTASAMAQTQPAQKAKPQAKPATAAPTLSVRTELPSEDTVNSFLYQMFGYDATITWKIAEIRPSEIPGLTEVTVIITNPQGSNANKLYVSADGKHAITGDILPFGAKPFDDARAKLEKGVNGAAKGPVKAPVMVVEFSDMQCPHCKTVAPNVEQLLAQEPDVHFVFQNFPLPAHNWAEKAAEYVDCVGRASNDAVWKFIQKTFDQQNNITESSAEEKLKMIATDSGVKADEISACAAKPDTRARIEASVALGKSVGVTGTPAIFVNGRALSGATPVDLLKKIVEFASQAKPAQPEAGNSK
jgi:protein-disulfide isomerase